MEHPYLVTLCLVAMILIGYGQCSNTSSTVTSVTWFDRGDIYRAMVRNSLSFLNESTNCSLALSELLAAFENHESWSVEFIDSSGNLRPGFQSGKYSSFGDYDQCLASNHREGNFRGQYCLLTMNVPKKENSEHSSNVDIKWSPLFKFRSFLRFAICIPSTCSESDIKHLISSVPGLPLNLTLETGCDTIDNATSQMSVVYYICAILLALVTSLSIAGTLSGSKSLSEFCIKTNTRKLFVNRTYEKYKNLAVIDGIRIGFIIFAQFSHMAILGYVVAPAFNGDLSQFEWKSFWFVNEFARNYGSPMVMQFMVSGLLAYNNLNSVLKQQEGKFSMIWSIYVHWIRTMPILATGVLFQLSLTQISGSGPLHREAIRKIKTNCYRNGLLEILGFGNFVPFLIWQVAMSCNDLADQCPILQCVLPNWGVNTAFQLYAIFLPIMVLLRKRKALALTIMAVLALASILLTGILLTLFRFPPFLDGYNMNFYFDLNFVMSWFHTSPQNYMSAYIFGILIAYLVINCDTLDIKWTIFGWTYHVAMFSAIFYIPATWHAGRVPSRLEEIMFGSVLRTLYSSAGAWAMYYLITHEDFMSRMLSCKAFSVIGKLFLPCYIGMILFMQYDIITAREPMMADLSAMFMRTVNSTICGAILAYVLYVLCVAPISALLARVTSTYKPIEVRHEIQEMVQLRVATRIAQ
ncbi:hypothetical protein HDE_05223 [Halotydeus destructor]|nr:hypothetical protein HDE_05223 [Halotydeus destructor]